jgi:hypothetical protein
MFTQETCSPWTYCDQVKASRCMLRSRWAEANSWWTPAQLEYAQAAAVGPLSRHLEKELQSELGRGFKYTPEVHDVPDLLIDPDDMLIVEPPCHPFEPLKIAEDWIEPLHCLMCGARFRI